MPRDQLPRGQSQCEVTHLDTILHTWGSWALAGGLWTP